MQDQDPLVFIESISLAFDLSAIERDIERTVREIVLRLSDEQIFAMTRERFAHSVPQKSDAHAVCARFGVTWGDLAMEMVRQGRGCQPRAA